MTRFSLLPLSLLAACTVREQPAAPDPTASTSVAAVEAPAPAPEFTGVIVTRESRVITADFEARVEELNLNTSQRVRKDEVFGRLDDDDLQKQLERAKASEKAMRGEVAAAGARAAALARQAKSEAILARQGAAPMAALRNAKAEASSAGASTSAASGRLGEAQVSRAQVEDLIKKATLRSPIDGVITMVSARKGQIVQKGSVLARVYDTSDLMVRFAVPKEQRKLIKPGGRVELSVEGVSHPIWASIQRISDEVEPPINFTIVEADIDDTKLQPDEVRVTASAVIRVADTTKTASLTTAPATTTLATR
jgi:multidrug efflux pump subunit AcrA (membrane-fusion protein)